MAEAKRKPKKLGRGGRPKAAELDEREAYLLRVAGEIFLDLGFDGTTMDEVAEAAGTSKRTLYARYPNKVALFDAVLRDQIDRGLAPIAQIQSDHSDLREALIALARALTTAILTPQSIAINRILVSESARSPQFGKLAEDAGRKVAVRTIASILRRHEAELKRVDFDIAAEQFMCLTLDNRFRIAMLNIHVSAKEIQRWVVSCVDLFLQGIGRRRHDK